MMNILFCGDHSVEDGILIATLSLIKHVREPLHIYVMTMTLSSSNGHNASPLVSDYSLVLAMNYALPTHSVILKQLIAPHYSTKHHLVRT